MRTLGWIRAFCWRAVSRAAYAVGDGVIWVGDFADARSRKARPWGAQAMNDSIWRAPGVVDRLRRLWDRGATCSEVGYELGVSKNAVAGARRRFGLPPRDLPPALEGVKNKPRISASARLGAGGVGGSRLAPPARQSLAEGPVPQPGPRAAAASAHDVSSLPNSAAGAAKPRPQLFVARGCQFPMWKHGEGPEHGAARYCDAQPRRNGEGRQDSPYCVEHHAKCFVLPVKKVAA